MTKNGDVEQRGLLSQLIWVILALSFHSSFASIDSQESVEIGGIKQWISIKGTNDKNPVLLHLHGGPGNPVMSFADQFTDELQKHFVVVQWDQRESGKTLELNASGKPLSVELMEADAVALVNYLRKRFSKDKIYLMGHSWGGFLALKIAADYPGLLHSCFALAPMINQLASERQSLEWMIDKARKANNQNALDQLAQVKIPFENGDQLYYHRRWIALFSGSNPPARTYVKKWSLTWLPLFNEASAVNYFLIAPQLDCPVYFFVGSYDRQVSSVITEQYFNALKAEKKDLFWFTNSGHNLNLTEPKKLQEIIISLLKS